MADEARLNELLDLVEQARAEGDTDTEQKAIAAYKRESAPAQPVEDPASFGGAGGFNPMLSRLGGGALAGGQALGMTPENLSSPLKNASAPAEFALQAGTGGLGAIAGGLAGIGQGTWNTLFPSKAGPQAADRVRQVQEAMTYQPRSGAGQATSRVVSAPAEAYAAGTNYLGEKATDLTGSPAVGAAIKTTGDIAPGLLGARALPKSGPKPKGEYTPTKNDIPTTEQLTAASKEAYKAGKESGVIVPADGYAKSLTAVRDMVTTEGIDPTLHPKSTAVMRRLEEANGKDLTLQEAETLRKIALDAEDDLNPVTRQATPDARLAGKIVDELDERIDALSTNSPARELWSRSRKSQMIDQMIHRAEIKAGAHYTQAGMEHALRQEFKQLALNPRRMRGLNAEQRAAVEKVAKGGPLENTLRTLGKFDPTTSAVSAMSSLGSAAVLSTVNPVAAGLPAAGFLGRRAATKMTERNVEKAREALVGRGTTSGGLLAKDNPTPLVGGQQGLLSKGPTAAKARSPVEIQSEIRALTARAQFELSSESAGSAKVQAFAQELARLQNELAASQASQ